MTSAKEPVMAGFDLVSFIGTRRAKIVSAIIAPVFGFLCMFFPVLLLKGVDYEKEYVVSSIVRYIWESQVPVPTVILLLAAGALLGFLSVRLWWLLGPLTMSVFPVVAVIDMMVWPTSHNLWPFEFIIYGLFCIPGLVGAFIGSRVGRRMKASEGK